MIALIHTHKTLELKPFYHIIKRAHSAKIAALYLLYDLAGVPPVSANFFDSLNNVTSITANGWTYASMHDKDNENPPCA